MMRIFLQLLNIDIQFLILTHFCTFLHTKGRLPTIKDALID